MCDDLGRFTQAAASDDYKNFRIDQNYPRLRFVQIVSIFIHLRRPPQPAPRVLLPPGSLFPFRLGPNSFPAVCSPHVPEWMASAMPFIRPLINESIIILLEQGRIHRLRQNEIGHNGSLYFHKCRRAAHIASPLAQSQEFIHLVHDHAGTGGWIERFQVIEKLEAICKSRRR